MKLFYKDENGNYVDVDSSYGSTNIFGNFNGFFGGETVAYLKIQAEVGENLKNVCVRMYETEVKNGGASLTQFMIRDEDDNQYLKSIVQNNIKIKFENKPYKNGIVFLTDLLNPTESSEVKGTFPYKEFEFTITAIVAERTVTDILSTNTRNISLEFIYN